MFLRQRPSAVMFIVLAALLPVEAATLSRQSADAFSQKVAAIRGHADRASQAGTRRTRITEDEFNSWFRYHGEAWQEMLPAGVTHPEVSIVGDGRVAARALVNLDAVAKRRSRVGAFDPLSLIGGTVPVVVTGVVHTREGSARFEVQSAEVSGIPVPVTVLQELVSYYSRTPERPAGVRLDEAFALPVGIRRVEIGKGQAVVVQ